MRTNNEDGPVKGVCRHCGGHGQLPVVPAAVPEPRRVAEARWLECPACRGYGWTRWHQFKRDGRLVLWVVLGCAAALGLTVDAASTIGFALLGLLLYGIGWCWPKDMLRKRRRRTEMRAATESAEADERIAQLDAEFARLLGIQHDHAPAHAERSVDASKTLEAAAPAAEQPWRSVLALYSFSPASPAAVRRSAPLPEPKSDPFDDFDGDGAE